MMAKTWTEDELRLALALYCQMPFGRMHSHNPDVVSLANRIGRTPSAVAMKLVNFASLDPGITGSGRKGLGNASALDRRVWERFSANWDAELSAATAELGVPMDAPSLDTEEPEPDLSVDTTRRAEVEIRRNQQLFRRMVVSSYAGRCCVSGLSEPRLLVASHIVPWKDAGTDRLNPRNGLCLSALHDRAFDRGLITVLTDYTIRVSPEIVNLNRDAFARHALASFDGQKIALPEKFLPSPEFLDWHNRHVFVG